MTPDPHQDALDRLIRMATLDGVRTGILAAQALLAVRQERSAADAILTHFQSICAHANAMYEAQIVIDRAREAA